MEEGGEEVGCRVGGYVGGLGGGVFEGTGFFSRGVYDTMVFVFLSDLSEPFLNSLDLD